MKPTLIASLSVFVVLSAGIAGGCREGTCAGVCEYYDPQAVCYEGDEEFIGCTVYEDICFMADDADECLSELKDRCENDPEHPDATMHAHDYFKSDCESCDDDCVYYPEFAAAPNIYLYPEATSTVSVTLAFSDDAALGWTIPEYGDGWNVTVESDGTIDGEHGYLFYEAVVNLEGQKDRGWAVERSVVMEFFAETLEQYGFAGREIDDFVDHWSVHLPVSACYLVYPQRDDLISGTVQLSVDPAPDNSARLWFVVEGAESCTTLSPPEVVPAGRDGFDVVEWGVVLR